MTYTHLTTNELTIIAYSFVQKLKAYRVAQMINRCAENVLSCHWLNSLISTTKLPRGGRLIPLLSALSAQLVVTYVVIKLMLISMFINISFITKQIFNFQIHETKTTFFVVICSRWNFLPSHPHLFLLSALPIP